MSCTPGASAGANPPSDHEIPGEDFIMVNHPLPQFPSAPPLAVGKSSVPYHPRFSNIGVKTPAQVAPAKLKANDAAAITAIDLDTEAISCRDFAKETLSAIESVTTATLVDSTSTIESPTGVEITAKVDITREVKNPDNVEITGEVEITADIDITREVKNPDNVESLVNSRSLPI